MIKILQGSVGNGRIFRIQYTSTVNQDMKLRAKDSFSLIKEKLDLGWIGNISLGYYGSWGIVNTGRIDVISNKISLFLVGSVIDNKFCTKWSQVDGYGFANATGWACDYGYTILERERQ